MKIMASIKQNHFGIPASLPDFRNLGFTLRILVMVNLMALAAVLVRSESLLDAWQQLPLVSAMVQPLLLASLLALYVLNRPLAALDYPLGLAAVMGVELVLATLFWKLDSLLFGGDVSSLVRWWLLTALAAATMLGYFNLRSRALSPARSSTASVNAP